MANERNIGRVVAVDSFSVYVRIDDDIKSLYKSGYDEIYPVARINSYIIIPVGSEKIVALINRVMTREETDLSIQKNSIFITESSRYLSATMVGTIDGSNYIQGVYNYPILDNPVWYITRDDLDIIFDQKKNYKKINYSTDYYLPIGTSPAFPDYQVKINPDKMFAKHVAILGNTGSGKSCTLAAIIQSMFKYNYGDERLKRAHIVIFDTNGEYKNAFRIDDKDIINPFWINEDGLRIPYWFMNYDDMEYLFEPTTGTQGPILKRALALAKSQIKDKAKKRISKFNYHRLTAFIDAINKGDYKSKAIILDDAKDICDTFKSLKDDIKPDFDFDEICNALDNIVSQCGPGKLYRNGNYPSGSYDSKIINAAIECITSNLDKYHKYLVENTTYENRNIDIPVYYEFKHLISSCFDFAINDSSVGQDKLNEYISTLKLRMQSFVDDLRLSTPLMLNEQKDINDVLVKFLAYILGDYCVVRNVKPEDKSIFDNYYHDSIYNNKHCQITIIDMSLLPCQVLETITGLIGRIILEFLSRFKKELRGSMPVVIALEEAQNYIPEINRKDKESISRRVFERIAREGRKYGLSLLVSSQRPSELSKTVLSQCNSFIIHRLQNPDDQMYIRKLVSSANSEMLNQLPTLPQQHVIIMGECVRTPVVAKMNTATPTPNSNNPEFINKWLKEDDVDYDAIVKEWLELRDDKA